MLSSNNEKIRFNRFELAGALGDVGTLFPLIIAMVTLNGVEPRAVFLVVSLSYLASGFIFRIPMSIQPMKVIAAYAIAQGVSAGALQWAALIVGVLLLFMSSVGLIPFLHRHISRCIIIGVQACTGFLLIKHGVNFIAGMSPLQKLKDLNEPMLAVQSVFFIPIGLILGIVAGFIFLLFQKSEKLPAGLLIISIGFLSGVLFHSSSLHIGGPRFALPQVSFPETISLSDFLNIFLLIVLPQLPMTVGNAVFACHDMAHRYYGATAQRVTPLKLTLSMGIMNLVSALVGGIPLCHGAGGLAAHYRFGARTWGSNLIIGVLLLILVLCYGPSLVQFISLLPLSILGILLIVSGIELCYPLGELKERRHIFIISLMVGITLATNLGLAFIVALILHPFTTAQ